MASYQVCIHPTALEDIEAARDWISENTSGRKALEWVDALLDLIESLAEMPQRCRLAPENGKWGPEELRQMLFSAYPSKYRILFHISGQTVHILQVSHGARRFLHEDE